MEYATHHLYFPYTHEPLGEFVYEENTSDKVGSNQETNIDNISLRVEFGWFFYPLFVTVSVTFWEPF